MKWVILFMIAFYLGFAMAYTPDRDKNGKDAVNFAELEEIIDRMNETKNKLKNVDRLLLDLLVADTENEQVINFLWDDLTKQNNRYSFTVTGDSEHLIAEVRAEQDRLRTSLLQDVEQIQRLHGGVNGNENEERK